LKKLITVDSCEVVEVIQKLQILLKKVDVEIGDFILVQLAGNRAFLVTQLNGFSAYECEIRYYKRLENINKFILDKKLYVSIIFSDILR